MYKKLKGLFLILVFSIQLLPVMQVGFLLALGQLTEEECFMHDDDQLGKETTYSLASLDIKPQSSSSDSNNRAIREEYINSRHSDDIQTPPPNLQ